MIWVFAIVMSTLRKSSDVWAQTRHLQGNITKSEWRRSHAGIKAALAILQFELHTSVEELNAQQVSPCYRKVCVSVTGGAVSKPVMIQHLLSGNTKLLGVEAMAAIYKAKKEAQIKRMPKGVSINNNAEKAAINDMHAAIGLLHVLDYRHVLEHRSADVIYSLKGHESYFPDQVKSATAADRGRVNFHVTVS